MEEKVYTIKDIKRVKYISALSGLTLGFGLCLIIFNGKIIPSVKGFGDGD